MKAGANGHSATPSLINKLQPGASRGGAGGGGNTHICTGMKLKGQKEGTDKAIIKTNQPENALLNPQAA